MVLRVIGLSVIKLGQSQANQLGGSPYLSWTEDVGRVESCWLRSVGVAVTGEGKKVESFESPQPVPNDSVLASWARS